VVCLLVGCLDGELVCLVVDVIECAPARMSVGLPDCVLDG